MRSKLGVLTAAVVGAGIAVAVPTAAQASTVLEGICYSNKKHSTETWVTIDADWTVTQIKWATDDPFHADRITWSERNAATGEYELVHAEGGTSDTPADVETAKTVKGPFTKVANADWIRITVYDAAWGSCNNGVNLPQG